MGAIVSIARNFEEYPIVRQLCLILFNDMNKNNPKSQNEALDEAEVCSRHTIQLQASFHNGCEVSETITSTLNGIMMALRQPHISMLGLYGSSKVRKGTVVEKITRRVKRDNLFDVVVMASVMKKRDLKRIQGELGNMLGLQLREKTLEGRASRLCDRIEKEEKILIILDDLWAGINLGRIGIPFGNDHKGCKIMLISESQEVLSDQMNTQTEFSVSLSSEDHRTNELLS